MLRQLLARLRYPRTTVRWRLTLLYGGLFLVCGAALLAITYTLVAKDTVTPGPTVFARFAQTQNLPPPGSSPTQVNVPPNAHVTAATVPPEVQRLLRSSAGDAVVRIVGHGQRTADLHQLIVQSAIALAIMAILAAALGWLVAGRVLRPLRTITATTQQISEANLHRRLAIPGPRDELRKLADTIDGLLERLEGAFDAQRRFVANASHELRTPLTATRALLEMALSDPGATIATFRDASRQALEESDRQEQLIDALLALAHGQRGIDQRERIDLAAVVREVLLAYETEATVDGLRVDASLEPAVITGDRRLIERLVSNLVQNAIRHNTPRGRVDVRIVTSGGQAVLAVSNTGPLVPGQEVQRLLQPFQRLAPERVHDHGGLGLGLSIVDAITSAHDASLDIHPGEVGGLEVEVRFPPVLDSERAGVTLRPPPVPGVGTAREIA
jgi:signal transduction histidine kinase